MYMDQNTELYLVARQRHKDTVTIAPLNNVLISDDGFYGPPKFEGYLGAPVKEITYTGRINISEEDLAELVMENIYE